MKSKCLWKSRQPTSYACFVVYNLTLYAIFASIRVIVLNIKTQNEPHINLIQPWIYKGKLICYTIEEHLHRKHDHCYTVEERYHSKPHL